MNLSIYLQPFAISIAAGSLIEVFFRLVKYSDEASNNPPKPKYRQYDLYISVAEFVSGGDRRWFGYVLFRVLPPAILLTLLAAVLNRYYEEVNIAGFLFIATATSLLFRDFLSLFQKKKTVSEKLIHLFDITIVLMVAAIISRFDRNPFLIKLAPSISGLIDNLWSSLLVALLIIFYFDATNSSKKYQEELSDKNVRNNYIIDSYNYIKDKFSEDILYACKKYDCSLPLLYAILIFENMNRPKIFRKIEELVVRTTNIPLTVGIAQVKSNKPLTDQESIYEAARILKCSRIKIIAISAKGDWFNLENVIRPYNYSTEYEENLGIILTELKVHAPLVFEEI